MVTWTEYFETAGALLAIYGSFRMLIWLELRDDFKPAPQSAPSNIISHPIDTTQLEDCLEKVRRDFAAEAHAHPFAANKSLLVEERRAEIAKLPFFQKPPPEPETPEKESGTPMLLAL